MGTKSEIELRCDIAGAKLGVAEELRWFVAGPFAFLFYLKYDSWIVAIVIGAVAFFLVTHWYEKEYDAANDAYERINGTGKYYKPSEPSDAA